MPTLSSSYTPYQSRVYQWLQDGGWLAKAFIVLSGVSWIVFFAAFVWDTWSPWGYIFSFPAWAFIFFWGALITISIAVVLEFAVRLVKALLRLW